MHAIHNARIQLLATALNNLGIGSIIAGIVVPMVKGEISGIGSFAIWSTVGVAFIGVAQWLLGRLR